MFTRVRENFDFLVLFQYVMTQSVSPVNINYRSMFNLPCVLKLNAISVMRVVICLTWELSSRSKSFRPHKITVTRFSSIIRNTYLEKNYFSFNFGTSCLQCLIKNQAILQSVYFLGYGRQWLYAEKRKEENGMRSNQNLFLNPPLIIEPKN